MDLTTDCANWLHTHARTHTGMPSLDGDDKVVGCVARETPSTGYYVRCYVVLDFNIHKLRMYPEEAELNPAQAECGTEINCQYITKVRASLTRPKALNSLGKQCSVIYNDFISIVYCSFNV